MDVLHSTYHYRCCAGFQQKTATRPQLNSVFWASDDKNKYNQLTQSFPWASAVWWMDKHQTDYFLMLLVSGMGSVATFVLAPFIKSKLCHNNIILWTFVYFIQCVCLCVCVFRMPLRPWRMRQPSRQWRLVSEGILSGGVLRGQLRQDGHALQLWRTARTLSHPRVLHVQRTAYHVRCQSTCRSPKNVKMWCTRHSVRLWISPRGWFLMDCSESCTNINLIFGKIIFSQ